MMHMAMRAFAAAPSVFFAPTRRISMCASKRAIVTTWDIDGTLLKGKGPGGNSFHKLAIEEGVKKIHGVDVLVNDIPHAGSTDRAIIRDMVVYAGLSVDVAMERMEDVIKVADEAIVRVVAEGGGLQHLILPGVREVLDALREMGATMALTTGNLESCAWTKLKAAGIDQYFTTGGFGSDCLDRSDILRVALERITKLDGAPELVKDDSDKYLNVAHVGDSLADVKAARETGTIGIGVLTGAFSREQLQSESPTVVFEDLSDTKAVLNAISSRVAEMSATD